MKWVVIAAMLASSFVAVGDAEAKGCIKGAIVGGIAGHFAGHHGFLGAAAGCAAGRHLANRPPRTTTPVPNQTKPKPVN